MYQSMWPDVLPRAGNRRLEKLTSLSPWFEIYKVSDSVFAVLEPGHTEEAISYLILGKKRAVLLDTGMGIANLKAEVERLTDLPVVVVVSPGHTAGSICLLDSRDKLLFTGDTFYPGMLFAHFEDSDFALYQKSIQYLLDLLPRVNHLCPSHNEAYVDKTAIVQVQEAFERIATDTVPFETEGSARVYRFDGFGLMVSA
jgi:glyoxylase-like metal-dependent hydrolase (beta-lactamase superfamily II)